MSARRAAMVVLALAAIVAGTWWWQRQGASSGIEPAVVIEAESGNGTSEDHPPLSATEIAAVTADTNEMSDVAGAVPAPAAETTPGSQAIAGKPTEPSAATPVLSASAARALMLERQRDQDCRIARSNYANTAREQSAWPWMPPELVAAERQAIAAATARMTAGCAALPADDAGKRRIQAQRLADLEAAIRAGDLYARLEGHFSGKPTPAQRAEWRATLYDAVLSGDPEAISRIWRLENRTMPSRPFTPETAINRVDLWGLIACDMGLDCGPGSRALDRGCFDASNSCGYDSVEAMIRDRTGDRQFQLLDQHRREIVERIRSGQVAGMFDPPPPPPPPGGG